MIIEKFALRWYHFLACWVLCIISGIILQTVFMTVVNGGSEAIFFALLTALIAAIISAPFIVLFCIIIHFNVLKKDRTRKQIHMFVFMWHSIGTVSVYLGLLVFANREMQNGAGEILLIMLGYFTVDSIYFSIFINRNTRRTIATEIYNEELLDF